MSPIALEFFGAPHIERDGAAIHLSRRKAVALLAYLAVTQQAHARDVLTALFWPELSQQRARANLRHTLYTLNDALGPGWLQTVEDQVALPSRTDLRIDVTKFRRLLASADAHHHTPPHLCESCIQSLTLAANLYRGDFLAGFALADAPEFDSFQLLQRESLQRDLSRILDQLAHVYAEAGRRQFDLAITYARRWLALDPLHEPAHRTLMHLYAESGDRVAAVRQFEECQRILAQELGVQPEPETTALLEQIRHGALSGDNMDFLTDALTLRSETPVHNLPLQATSFIGRERELDLVAARIADPDCRLLTIVGPGGSGKTRLAIQSAAAQTTLFRDGVRFVDLSPVESPDLLAASILRSLDAPELGSADSRQRLCTFLQPKQMLLVLDNLEHLLDGVDLLAHLLRAAPDVTLLVTSRERLNVHDEWLFPLDGLSVPPGPPPGLPPSQPQATPDLHAYDATRLFVSRMRQLRPNYVPQSTSALPADDAAAIAAICRLLEGMPLAIELAAGWTRTLTLRQLHDEIAQSLNVLSSSLRDVPPRLRSMRAAFDHSWRLLSPSQRSILRQMSVFRGGCTRDAAQHVTRASVADLSSLVDKSWLRLREGGRYMMHELARQYCEEKLAAQGDQAGDDSPDAVRQRHCAFYGPYISNVIGSTNYKPSTLDDIMTEFGNLRTALRSAIANDDTQSAASICWSVFFVGDMKGWLSFSIQTLESVVPLLMARLDDSTLVEPMRTQVLHVYAVICHTLFCQYSQLSINHMAKASNEQLSSTTDKMAPGRTRIFWQALALDDLGSYYQHIGEYDRSLSVNLDALSHYTADEFECLLYGDERRTNFWKCVILSELVDIYWAQGDYDTAYSYSSRCMALQDESGEQRFRGMHLDRNSHMMLITGDYDRAEEFASEGLRLSELYGDNIGIGLGHLAVGRVLACLGRHAVARRHLHTSLETGRHSGRIDLVIKSLFELGRIHLTEGDPESARHRFEDALAAFEHSNADHHNSLTSIWLGLGWKALAQNNVDEARALFEKAHDQRGAMAFEIQESNAGLAHVLLAKGQISQATELWQTVFEHPATAHATRQLAKNALETAEPGCVSS